MVRNEGLLDGCEKCFGETRKLYMASFSNVTPAQRGLVSHRMTQLSIGRVVVNQDRSTNGQTRRKKCYGVMDILTDLGIVESR